MLGCPQLVRGSTEGTILHAGLCSTGLYCTGCRHPRMGFCSGRKGQCCNVGWSPGAGVQLSPSVPQFPPAVKQEWDGCGWKGRCSFRVHPHALHHPESHPVVANSSPVPSIALGAC